MSLQAIFTIFILSTLNLGFANCLTNPFQKSELPKVMPENTKMSWKENGGMAPEWKSIEITQNQILFEEKTMQGEEPRFWFVEIPLKEKEEIYRVFVVNKFDTIKNDERKEIVYDAGSEGVYLRAGKISKSISYGSNSPLSGFNKRSYSAVASALKALEGKYKDQAKEVNKNFAIIDYSAKKHNFISKTGKRTNLNYLEIDKFFGLIEKAVSQHNEKQNDNQKIKDLAKYKFQFLPILNEKGEKEIYVNALCSYDNENWKKELIMVSDGGSCFFQMFLNLSTKKINEVSVNGEA